MKKIILLGLIYLSITSLFSQGKSVDTEFRHYFDFKAGETVYLFGDKLIFR